MKLCYVQDLSLHTKVATKATDICKYVGGTWARHCRTNTVVLMLWMVSKQLDESCVKTYLTMTTIWCMKLNENNFICSDRLKSIFGKCHRRWMRWWYCCCWRRWDWWNEDFCREQEDHNNNTSNFLWWHSWMEIITQTSPLPGWKQIVSDDMKETS